MTSLVAGNRYLPSWLPAGYELEQRVEGQAAQGFGVVDQATSTFRWASDELAYVFRNGTDDDAWTYPLLVHVGGDSDWSLTGTEKRRGEPVTLDAADRSAVYHDGIWQPGENGPGNLVWTQNGVHSLTVRWDSGVWAVRGSRSRGVSQADLLAIANSVFTS